jgi:hypothetical protein
MRVSRSMLSTCPMLIARNCPFESTRYDSSRERKLRHRPEVDWFNRQVVALRASLRPLKRTSAQNSTSWACPQTLFAGLSHVPDSTSMEFES